MSQAVFSFIILTYNEEIHLERLLDKLKPFNAPVHIVDSGSTDATLQIAEKYNATVKVHAFENHPQQWEYALNNCEIETEWVICLDADQYPSAHLCSKLLSFNTTTVDSEVNGIYFNRHNYFRGKRLKYGGYRNFYLLKMFRYGKGISDRNQKMDHRFIVTGKTIIWKDAVLAEDNLKEHDIDFWIQKHLKYSTLVAEEEWERSMGMIGTSLTPDIGGSPDEKTAYLKGIWWKLPLFVRPVLYFSYRFFIRLGFLENRDGRIFHYLHAYWFRMLIDYKLYQLRKNKTGK